MPVQIASFLEGAPALAAVIAGSVVRFAGKFIPQDSQDRLTLWKLWLRRGIDESVEPDAAVLVDHCSDSWAQLTTAPDAGESLDETGLPPPA